MSLPKPRTWRPGCSGMRVRRTVVAQLGQVGRTRGPSWCSRRRPVLQAQPTWTWLALLARTLSRRLWLPPPAVPARIVLLGPSTAPADDLTLAALTTARLSQLAQAPEAAQCIISLHSGPGAWLYVLAQLLPAFTALESLDVCHPGLLLGIVEPVWGLARLTHLAFDGGKATGSWSSLSRLTQLRHLGFIAGSDHAAVAAALPHLSLLTCLTVSPARHGNPAADWSTVSSLTALRELNLVCRNGAHVLQHLPADCVRKVTLCTGDLAALPAHLSKCTALESLDLEYLSPADAPVGATAPLPAKCFSHLAPLTRLGVSFFRITPPEVPQALAIAGARSFSAQFFR